MAAAPVARQMGLPFSPMELCTRVPYHTQGAAAAKESYTGTHPCHQTACQHYRQSGPLVTMPQVPALPRMCAGRVRRRSRGRAPTRQSSATI